MVQIAGIVRKGRLEDVQPSVTVIIAHADAHPCLLMAVLAVSAAGYNRDIGEGAVVIVAEQHAGLRVHGHINIGPPVVVEIVRDRCNGISRARLQDARLLGYVGKGSVSVVVVKNICVTGKTARAAHYGDPFPLAKGIVGRRSFFRIEPYVIANEKIQVPISVVVEKSTARTPADLLIVSPGLASDVGERSVAIVVEQNVVSPEAAKQVVPAVVVVVDDADARLPASACQSGFFRHVGEGAVAIIFVFARGGSFHRGPI